MKYRVTEASIGDQEKRYVNDALDNSEVSSMGSYVRDFESHYADHCGVKHALATSNGTTALHLALIALGISPGDEVIVPDLTFVATANAVVYCGATPVFVDVDPDYWAMDPEQVNKKITSKTKAIIAVHLYGHPANVQELRSICTLNNLYLIEDAAEAHGAFCFDERVGSLGDINCFSFYGNKILTTGEGGMVTTNSDDLAYLVKQYRDQGTHQDRRYWHPVIGYNYRMTNLSAAVGLAQLERIDEIVEKKEVILQKYKKSLVGAPLKFQVSQPWAKPVNWLTSVVLTSSAPISASRLMVLLSEMEIETRPFFIPMHELPPYLSKESFPVAEELSKNGLNLPSAISLKDSDIKYICDATLSILNQ